VRFENSRGDYVFASRTFFDHDFHFPALTLAAVLFDKSLVELGYHGPDAYLKDENGNPVPETVHKVDKKAMQSILEWCRRDKWGEHPKIDAPHEGGVLACERRTGPPIKAAQRSGPGTCRDRSTKAPVTWHARSQTRGKAAPRDDCARKLKCCSPISNAFSSSIGSD